MNHHYMYFYGSNLHKQHKEIVNSIMEACVRYPLCIVNITITLLIY